MPLDDYLARKDWIGPRQDRWTDILPESWQTAINTSPTLNALARYLNRPSFEAGVKEWQDSIPGNSPIDRIADRKSTFAQEFPSPMNPLGQSLMETGGFLANFIGPGAKLPPAAAPKPQGVFDDKLIEILRKYGLLPPVAAGAAQSLSQGQDTAY